MAHLVDSWDFYPWRSTILPSCSASSANFPFTRWAALCLSSDHYLDRKKFAFYLKRSYKRYALYLILRVLFGLTYTVNLVIHASSPNQTWHRRPRRRISKFILAAVSETV